MAIDNDINLKVSVAQQTLHVIQNDITIKSYQISTALNGCNEKNGSGGTPRGKHYIRAMIGTGADKNSVFIGRRKTGEVFSQELSKQYPNRDWILGRIMWLCGLEVGKNRLGDVDTMQRYIYIHGTPDVEQLGKPVSHGCIRMSPDDVVGLFDIVKVGIMVDIVE